MGLDEPGRLGLLPPGKAHGQRLDRGLEQPLSAQVPESALVPGPTECESEKQ